METEDHTGAAAGEFECPYCHHHIRAGTADEVPCPYCGSLVTPPEGQVSSGPPASDGSCPDGGDGAEEEENLLWPILLTVLAGLILLALLLSLLFPGGGGGRAGGSGPGADMAGRGPGRRTGSEDAEKATAQKPSPQSDARRQSPGASERRKGGDPMETGPAASPSLDQSDGGKVYTVARGDAGPAGLVGGGVGGSGPSFFGIWDVGEKIVYVVDRSGSMQGSKLSAAKRELGRALETLGPNRAFSVIFYNNSTRSLPPGTLQEATSENVSDAMNWVRGIFGSGGTRPLPGLIQALKMQPDAVFLLSDGQFGSSSVLSRIHNANASAGARIHTIGFGTGSALNAGILQSIARQNNGIYRAYAP